MSSLEVELLRNSMKLVFIIKIENHLAWMSIGYLRKTRRNINLKKIVSAHAVSFCDDGLVSKKVLPTKG